MSRLTPHLSRLTGTRLRSALTFVALIILAEARGQDGYRFTTLAGSPREVGDFDRPLSESDFRDPTGIAVAMDGSILVADSGNATIRRITADSITTLAGLAGSTGTRDGPAREARFGETISFPSKIFTTPSPPPPMVDWINGPQDLAQDSSGTIFIVDTGSTTIRELRGNVVSTLAGGFQTSATRFVFSPKFEAIPAPPHASIDGQGGDARFMSPSHIALDANGALYISDTNAHTIRKIEGDVVTTFAGIKGVAGATDGPLSEARFNGPAGLTFDRNGNLYVVDSNNFVVRKITPAGQVSTLAGSPGVGGSSDGNGVDARFGSRPPVPQPSPTELIIPIRGLPVFKGPRDIAATAEGSLVVTDTVSHTIRLITPAGVVTTVGGRAGERGYADGIGSAARFYEPRGIAIDRLGNIYITDANQIVRKGSPLYLPRFQAQPADQLGSPGQTLTLEASLTENTLPITYQWQKDGVSISGATSSKLILSTLTTAQNGTYTLVATNELGSIVSRGAAVVVATAPAISSTPGAQDLLGGERLELSVSATGQPALSFQWQKDGGNIAGATRANFTIDSAQEGDAGSYRVIVSNSGGSVSSPPIPVSVITARLANLSIRTVVTPAAPILTVGFVIAGANKPLLARAIGPGLRPFGLEATLADPRITLFSGDRSLGTNDDWASASNATDVTLTSSRLGAFPLVAQSADAAVLSFFNHGAYSAQITGHANMAGTVLVELYDADRSTAARLVNVSARAHVGTGDEILVAGFVITGNAKKTLLVRAVGPTLSGFGVANALADPKLEVVSASSGTIIAANDDWGGLANLSAAFAARGAFPLSSADSKDAALLVTLDPGNYSVQVSDAGGRIGEALVELYEIP